MASRRLVPASVRESLLGIPSDIGSLERTYVLPDEDLELIATRRRPDNRLGLAIHIALLRHPGQGWLDGIEPPSPLIAWLAEQVDVSSDALTRYGTREPTRSEHRRLAIRHLGLRAFLRAEHMRAAILLAARSAFDTDDGGAILTRLTTALRTQRFVLPSPVTLERIGLAGRARARRLAAQAINDALDAPHKQALMELLKHDLSLGRSRLTWLRALPHSTSAASMQGLLDRLKQVRALGLPRDLGEAIHPARLAKFARELAADEGGGALRMLGGEQGVPDPALRLVLDHHQPQAFDIAHLSRHVNRRTHRCIQASRRGPLRMGTRRGQRELSRALQHLERRQAPGELRRSAGIDEPELRAHFAPEGGAALARTLCHNVTETRLSLGRTQCLEDLALEPHTVDYTRTGVLCSASLVGTGQR